jgi:uncharacterized protein YjbI with pentapeptide repeats
MSSFDIQQIVPEAPCYEEGAELVDSSCEIIVDRCELAGSRFSQIPSTQRSDMQPNIKAKSASFDECAFHGDVLARSTLTGVQACDCVFEQADLAGSTWTDARIVRTQFTACRLTGWDARMSTMRDVVFNECKLRDGLLSETTLARVRFDSCQLTDLDLSYAQLESVAIHRCDARNLRLDNARIGLLDLRSSIIDGIALDATQLKGIVIDQHQAPVIAMALGVRICE